MCQFTTLLFGKKRFFEPLHASVYNFIYETGPDEVQQHQVFRRCQYTTLLFGYIWLVAWHI